MTSHSALLRASGEQAGKTYTLESIKAGAAGDSGVAHDGALIAFAEAVVLGAEAELDRARQALLDTLGAPGFVDAAAVVGTFNAMVRVADATGIPLEGFRIDDLAAIRAELGLID